MNTKTNETYTQNELFNTLKISKGGYINIPAIDAYKFSDGPFTVMGYVTPKKSLTGNTELTLGTIFSSKPAPGGLNNGGWQLLLEKVNEEYYLCFKVDDGFGYHLLRAPLNNLYDNKIRLFNPDSVLEKTLSQTLFMEYTHFVAAVNGGNGDLSIYVDGYLLATATPLDKGNKSMDANSFQLKTIYKEAEDTPTHFFTLKKDKSSFSVGYGNWDSDDFTQLGESFQLENNFKEITIPDHEKSKCGISAIRIQKIKNVTPAKGMIPSDEIVFSIIPLPSPTDSSIRIQQKGTIIEGKVLSQFLASSSDVGSVNNKLGLRIGSTEQYLETDLFEGFVKHISLWKKALSQQQIISFMDHDMIESDHFDCIGFWKLESDFNDSSPYKNHGEEVGDTKFVNLPHTLPVYMEDQIDTQWCWSATGLAIVEFYNPLSNLTQKDIVDNQKKKNPKEFANTTNRWWYVSDFLDEETKHVRNRYFRNTDKLLKTLNLEFLEKNKIELENKITELQKEQKNERENILIIENEKNENEKEEEEEKARADIKIKENKISELHKEEEKALADIKIKANEISELHKGKEKIISEFQNNSGKEIVSFDFIKDEINNISPLIARIGWFGKHEGQTIQLGGHFMCITGVIDNLLVINDPLFGITKIDFNQFLNGYNTTGRLTDIFTTCTNNSNFITRATDFKLRTGDYQLFYNKDDGNLTISKITIENEKETIKEIAKTGENFQIEKIEFEKDGTTVIHKEDGSKLKISHVISGKKPKSPFTLDLTVDGDKWDVNVVEVSISNTGQSSSGNIPNNRTLYSIKNQLFSIA